MPLNRVNRATTERYEDGDDWLVLRLLLSKTEGDEIADLQSNYRVQPGLLVGAPEADNRVELFSRIADVNKKLFSILAVEWSLGKPGEKPTGADYAELDEDSGRWVDTCIGDVLRKRREADEGKAPSPAQPSESPTDSVEDSASS